jgi:hypothetical protein
MDELTEDDDIPLELILKEPISESEPDAEPDALTDPCDTLANELIVGLKVPLLEWVDVGGGLEIDTEFVCVVVSVAELVHVTVFLAEKLCETVDVAVFVANEDLVILIETIPLRELRILNE